jgi:ParB family chromosome partitioning protein
MALVENIQRENLNAMEIAVSYQRLLDECSLTQEEMSEKVGKKRSTVANYLRLLKLSHEAKIAIRDNKISMGHARALVSVDNEEIQAKIVNQIINQELSVRQTESLVKKFSNTVKKTKVTLTLSDEIVNYQTSLSEKLQTKVVIKKELSGKGKITIPFTSDLALKEMLEKLQ